MISPGNDMYPGYTAQEYLSKYPKQRDSFMGHLIKIFYILKSKTMSKANK